MAKTYRILRMLYKKSSGILYNFTPNKSYAYLLNSESSNLVFLRTQTLWYSLVISQLHLLTKIIEHQKQKTKLIDKKLNDPGYSQMEMVRYFIEPGTKKYVKIYKFLSFGSNQSNKCGVKNHWMILKKQYQMPYKLGRKGQSIKQMK